MASALASPSRVSAAKSVTFIPLSPTSSRTMARHREGRDRSPSSSSVDSDLTDRAAMTLETGPGGRIRPTLGTGRPRRGSDPSADRPKFGGSGGGKSKGKDLSRRDSLSDPSDWSDLEDEVEELPARFDSKGRPLSGGGPSSNRASTWHSRSGSFDYVPRDRKRGGSGVQAHGDWTVAGTDPEAVDRIVRGVTGVLEGKEGWMGLLGTALAAGTAAAGGSSGRKDRSRSRSRSLSLTPSGGGGGAGAGGVVGKLLQGLIKGGSGEAGSGEDDDSGDDKGRRGSDRRRRRRSRG